VADLLSAPGGHRCCLGAALSNGVAGIVVDKAAIRPPFLVLAGCAALAFPTLWTGTPETRGWQPRDDLTPARSGGRSARFPNPPLLRGQSDGEA
jgi:hypothetical protein